MVRIGRVDKAAGKQDSPYLRSAASEGPCIAQNAAYFEGSSGRQDKSALCGARLARISSFGRIVGNSSLDGLGKSRR